MPSITINGTRADFTPGEKILQVANRAAEAGKPTEIPQYCYHDGLSIPAQCRICLAEVWAPNPRAGNKLEPLMGGKLLPTCSTEASDGMVVYTNSPQAVANQKAVMEYLLINHPLDCPVCDQAGECYLQDYSYKYGRGVSRFEEQKVKQPKKDLGPHVYIYADRCIMCTRCVRFTREWPQTGELMIDGRGNKSEIDVFPGVALDNELSGNVIDLCPVGALLDKDFLFAQRVWFLKSTPSIDGLTSSGDNILIEHNEGRVYRVKPRANAAVNKWWITDEVRYGWKFVHGSDRVSGPLHRRHGTLFETDFVRAYRDGLEGLRRHGPESGKRLGLLVSPMLTCEEAFALGTLARAIDPGAVLAVGPVPVDGVDRHYPPEVSADDPRAYHVRAEKAPNARGVRRVLDALNGGAGTPDFAAFLGMLGGHGHGHGGGGGRAIGSVLVTGNYPSVWATEALVEGLIAPYVVLIDTIKSRLFEVAGVVLPSVTWAEKAGTFENWRGQLQAFEQAIPAVGVSKSEGQMALDMVELLGGGELDRPVTTADDVIVDEGPGQVPASSDVVSLPRAGLFNAASVRAQMAGLYPGLGVFAGGVSMPVVRGLREPDMALVEL